jgi:hypothetical protein
MQQTSTLFTLAIKATHSQFDQQKLHQTDTNSLVHCLLPFVEPNMSIIEQDYKWNRTIYESKILFIIDMRKPESTHDRGL